MNGRETAYVCVCMCICVIETLYLRPRVLPQVTLVLCDINFKATDALKVGLHCFIFIDLKTKTQCNSWNKSCPLRI